MKRLLALCCVLALAGCARFTTMQEDTSESGRSIKTQVKAVAWFSSVNKLTGVKLTQTDKTQSVGTTSIGQQGETNMVAILNALAGVLSTLRPTP